MNKSMSTNGWVFHRDDSLRCVRLRCWWACFHAAGVRNSRKTSAKDRRCKDRRHLGVFFVRRDLADMAASPSEGWIGLHPSWGEAVFSAAPVGGDQLKKPLARTSNIWLAYVPIRPNIVTGVGCHSSFILLQTAHDLAESFPGPAGKLGQFFVRLDDGAREGACVLRVAF